MAVPVQSTSTDIIWPSLPLADWQDTYTTLHAYPEPDGFRDYPIQPQAAFYSSELKEFILPYTAVRQAEDPDALLLAFFQSTYAAAANLGHWDRAALERSPV